MLLMAITLVILGLVLGSFINALVWRLHEHDELKGTKLTKKQQKYWRELSLTRGRSMCPDCHHKLAAADLLPVVSWVSLRGRCRYCGKAISWQYPLVEMMTAVLFGISYSFWPSGFHGAGLLELVVWLACLVGFMALAVYDLRWYLLPNRIVYPLLGLVAVQILARLTFFHGGQSLLLGSLYGILIGGGFFYVLFQVSGGKWIGGGDVKLGALLGLLVGGPLKACLVLFIASLAGTLVSLPLLALGKVKRTTVVPFGPFLLLAAVIVGLFGSSLVSWLQNRGLVP
jgi:leader peptidase (prepilin peptidase)/N-methyltransferase